MSPTIYWISILFAAWSGAIVGVMITCCMVLAKRADKKEEL